LAWFSNAWRISAALLGIESGAAPAAISSELAIRSANPGKLATCIANSPSDRDFSCGFQPSLSVGTRSSTRRVAGTSSRNSIRMDSTAGTISFISFESVPVTVHCRRFTWDQSSFAILSPTPDALDDVLPSLVNVLPDLVWDNTERIMMEGDQRTA